MKKLPIGIQSFEKLREGDFVYVDKTQMLHEMLTSAGVYAPLMLGKILARKID